MRVQPEDGRAVGGRVRPHPLEDAGAVLEAVRQHVHFCVAPGDEFSVEPDFLSWREAHNALHDLNIYRDEGPRPISRLDVSEFRIEKRRAEATLTLTTGATVHGCFFLSASSASHAGPERVADLLNGEAGFFPFELNRDRAALHRPVQPHARRAGVAAEAPSKRSWTRLQPRDRARGPHAPVQRQHGRRGGSASTGRADAIASATMRESRKLFRYVETADGTVIVNADHIVELRETTEA